MSYGTVMKRKRGTDGELQGRSNVNPILDTSIYKVEFDNGSTEACSANIIAEHIYSQVDEEGYTQHMLNEIVDHKKDSTAVSKEGGITTTKAGRKLPRRMTKGLQFLMDTLRDLNSVLRMNPKASLLHGLDDPVPFLHGVGNPPSKGRFLCKTIVYGILGHLKQV